MASLDGQAVQQTSLSHRFTLEEARKAGEIGGAKISSNREHMREIGARGDRAKRGYTIRRQQAQMSAEAERAANEQAPVPKNSPDRDTQRHSLIHSAPRS